MNDSSMPSWHELATKIAHDFIDCQQRADAADAAGDKKEAAAFRKLSARYKRMMNKYGITIRS